MGNLNVVYTFQSLSQLADYLDGKAEENYIMAKVSPTKKAQREGKAYARGIEFAVSLIRESVISVNEGGSK